MVATEVEIETMATEIVMVTTTSTIGQLQAEGETTATTGMEVVSTATGQRGLSNLKMVTAAWK